MKQEKIPPKRRGGLYPAHPFRTPPPVRIDSSERSPLLAVFHRPCPSILVCDKFQPSPEEAAAPHAPPKTAAASPLGNPRGGSGVIAFLSPCQF
jgi:hypothetical protein